MPVPVPTRAALRVKYTQPWKGGVYNPSCKFFLTTSGGAHTPPDTAHWQALADDLVLRFKDCLGDFSTIESVDCYPAGSNIGLHTFVYSTAGTQTVPAGGQRLPGPCAQLMKWTTDQRTTKNHPIYLFNYVHGLYNFPGTPDAASQRGAINTFGARLASTGAGLSDGATTYFKSGPYGAAAQTHVDEIYVTDHNLFT